MPKLQATIGAPKGTMVWWKLSVINHDRNGNPYRNFDTGTSPTGLQVTELTNVNETGSVGYSDDIDVPMPSGSADSGVVGGWVPIAAGTPWNIYSDADWSAAVARGFFGGDAELSVKITSSDGSITILPEQDFYFRIAGENPVPATCKAYIQSVDPGKWWSYAIAKTETKGDGGRTYYNQFMDNGAQVGHAAVPAKDGVPDWNNDGAGGDGTGGYGLLQLTYDTTDTNFIMPRGWIWNWQQNVQQGINDIETDVDSAINYVSAQRTSAVVNSQSVPVPKISTSRVAAPDNGEPQSQPMTMTGGDSVYGYPTGIATASFYDDSTKPSNGGEIIEVAESIKNYNSGIHAHYENWNGSAWVFTRGRAFDNLSYVDLVSIEIEAADSHAVSP